MRRLAVLALVTALPVRAMAGDDPDAVTAKLAGTRVHLQARFAFEIDHPGVSLNTYAFTIPEHAVVTAGAVVVDGVRHRLALQRAEEADRAFDALIWKPADHGERAWAFLVDQPGGEVIMDVLAPRAAHAVLELTLDAPTCFYKDVRYLALPASWHERVPAALRAAPRAPEDEITAACRAEADEDRRWLGFAVPHLREQPAGERRIGTIAGRLPLESTHFAHVEIDLARELGDVPGDLHTAIVIDHSRSLTVDELDVQRAIVAAYLRAAPASRVQVIAFARRAQALLPSWMTAAHAGPQIDRAIRALPPRNGSNLDVAVGEAIAWLARVRGTKRIVVFTDEQLPARLFAGTDLHDLVAGGVLLHVVRPSTSGLGLERDDELELADLAKQTRGIAVRGAVDDGGNVDATLLVRPTSLDHLTIGDGGWQLAEGVTDARPCDASLAEGETCSWWGQSDGGGGPVAIKGLLWNQPFERVVRPDPSHARELARTLSAMQVLAPELQTQVDRIALAINSVWSLFGQWGGTGGYEDLGGFGTMGTGGFTTGGGITDFVGTVGPGTGPIDLRRLLQPAVDSCRPGPARVVVHVETTREEIVDVTVEVAPASPALHDCIVEAVWDTTLRLAHAPARAERTVAFGNDP
jgi:hypothetical protein